jgi:hypothetical protein
MSMVFVSLYETVPQPRRVMSRAAFKAAARSSLSS